MGLTGPGHAKVVLQGLEPTIGVSLGALARAGFFCRRRLTMRRRVDPR